jgi:hypothetical protein
MLETRKAVFEDAALIADHRKAMFAAMGGDSGGGAGDDAAELRALA